MFFEINETLCQRYTSLTPFVVRKEKLGEVILLINRINEKNDTDNGLEKGDQVIHKSNGDVVIRRKATNDNWY